MLPKNRRIPRKELGPVVFKGKKYNSPHLLLSIASTDSPQSKFAFSVSKKVAKSAVERNKYRRRGYSVIGKQLHALKGGYLLMFNFKKGAIPIEFAGLEKEVLGLLSDSFMLS